VEEKDKLIRNTIIRDCGDSDSELVEDGLVRRGTARVRLQRKHSLVKILPSVV
jgi:hypothetical protein